MSNKTSVFDRANACLAAMAPSTDLLAPGLQGALESAVGPGGKRSRMLLILGSGDALGLPETCTDMLAVSVEYFHTASLVIDDLPAMDDAKLRHGRPCVHLTHGQPNALLAALTLISRAYLMAEMALSHLPREVRVRAHLLIDRALGGHGLSGGQAADLAFQNSEARWLSAGNRVSRIALMKTGGLIRLCLLLPALAAGVSEKELRSLSRLAVYWSLSYQMIDDLKDVEGSQVEEGKSLGRDGVLGRPNLALAEGRAAVLARVQRLRERALVEMDRLAGVSASWAHLRAFHEGCTRIQRTAQVAA